jgi:hypothetical protein
MLPERTPVLVKFFAEIQNLSEAATTCLFWRLLSRRFRDLDGTSHKNIRNFMKTGWDGIAFYGEALELKKII